MDNPVCPNTGAPMYRDKRPLTLTYKGQSTSVEMPGWYCSDCDESIHVGEDLKVSDRALTLLKARCEGLLPPGEIERIRKKLRLTQEQAGLIIGGGPRAFQKYESGDLLPCVGTNNVLLLLDQDPDMLELLRKRQGTCTVARR